MRYQRPQQVWERELSGEIGGLLEKSKGQYFGVFSILAGLDSSQAHSLVISADWNEYELTEGNDDAYGQTVRRRVVLEM